MVAELDLLVRPRINHHLSAYFEKLTGITLKVDGYQEQQMQQRLVTVMNAHSDEVDVFMTLPSREGQQFAAAGWYADLASMAKGEVAADYDTAGLSQALLKAGTFDRKLTSMPMNIEGPIDLSPLRLTLMMASLVYLDGLWLHRHPYFAWAAGVCMATAGMGHSVTSINDNSVRNEPYPHWKRWPNNSRPAKCRRTCTPRKGNA